MIILLNNREYTFDDIEQENDYLYIKSKFKFNSILTNYKLTYLEFMDLFKLSQDCYVNITDYDNLLTTIEEYFNYFKITTNDLVKRNMVSKITYLMIDNFKDKVDENIYKIINKHKPVTKDKYYVFLKIIAKLSSVRCIVDKNNNLFDEDYFTLNDFILDYYD